MKTKIVKLLVVGCGLAIICILALGPLSKGNERTGIKEGTQTAGNHVSVKAPDFTLNDLNGHKVSLSDFRDKKGVLLVFFATWCPHCVAETPHLIEFHNNYKDEDIALYGINIQQSPQLVKKFVERNGINYPILLDDQAKAANAYHVNGIPLVVGIDAKGFVQYRSHFFPHSHDLESLLKRLAKGVSNARRSKNG